MVAHRSSVAFGEIRVEVSSEKGDAELKLLVDAHGKCIHASRVVAWDGGLEAGFGSFTVSVLGEFE